MAWHELSGTKMGKEDIPSLECPKFTMHVESYRKHALPGGSVVKNLLAKKETRV